ncbi:MAG: acetyl-CoA carboxylase biotin carboxylase subunit [Luminiphilus sp.]|nr:acetyl-CoA carboxylase biotin carboxylase subunit [Luminiphilus sp.]
MKALTTMLVANRGEIAVRVMRTAKAMGMKTVAVYSEADANAQHVREADQSVCIGPAAVAESYLCIEAILDAAQRTGADCIHPGYGFLSENQVFASACEAHGIEFIGPPNGAIEVMGDKARAKRAMIEAGVPCVPGYQGDDQSLVTLVAEAKSVGLPVMVKAAAGGGGRGMRLVHEASELESAIGLAQSEAQNAFGSSELIIEKAVVRPRHVEIQVFADKAGNTVYLGERDCSIQRRHQKVVEESPCPVMTSQLREAMGTAAVEAAKAVGYVGAGTVEFLLDEAGEFYFLEMNTRLQVEHPVTEMVTGYDLVEWQIRVARGEDLPAEQADIDLFGHAIEVRLYAEDPSAGFLPSTGPIKLFAAPEGEGVRIDSGVETGDEVTPFYDAMVAKLITYGETREDARLKMRSALRDTALFGPLNNRDFLLDVLDRPDFIHGAATTAFIDDNFGDAFLPPGVSSSDLAVAAATQHVLAMEHHHSQSASVNEELLDWVSMGRVTDTRRYDLGEQTYDVSLVPLSVGEYEVTVNDQTHHVRITDMGDSHVITEIDGLAHRYHYHDEAPATLYLSSDNLSMMLADSTRIPPEAQDAAGGGTITAPMHGQLLSIDVAAGEAVQKGQRIAVLEAMKMQHEIIAPGDGCVVEVAASAGKQIGAGDVIMMLELDE